MGVQTIGQLAAVPARISRRASARARAGSGTSPAGIDDRAVEPFAPPKSMGAEETFGRDHRDVERLRATLREQAERVARELRADGYAGRCVTLKLRFADFSTLTRRHTDDPTQDGLGSTSRARALLDRIRLRQPVRLIGLSVPRSAPPRPASSPCSSPTRAPGAARARHGSGHRSLRRGIAASGQRGAAAGRTRPSDPRRGAARCLRHRLGLDSLNSGSFRRRSDTWNGPSPTTSWPARIA